MEYVLQTDGLTKTYRGKNAVDNLNLNIPEGAIYGFVGRNGSGKTTLIRLITGLISPTSGDYALYGARNKKELLQVRRKIAAVVETPSIYLNMSARDNMRMQCRLLGLPDAAGDEALNKVNLTGTGSKHAKDFSLGMKQRLGIAIALLGAPSFLILDEPTNGLDPEGIVEMRQMLLSLNREQGITMLVSSHILTELSRLATHFGLIDGGKLLREVTADELVGAGGKLTRITVDNSGALPAVIGRFPAISRFRILSPTVAELIGQFDIAQFIMAVDAAGIKVTGYSEEGENLEHFYMQTIGGGN